MAKRDKSGKVVGCVRNKVSKTSVMYGSLSVPLPEPGQLRLPAFYFESLTYLFINTLVLIAASPHPPKIKSVREMAFVWRHHFFKTMVSR